VPAIQLRELKKEDMPAFLAAIQSSQSLHTPWVKAPLTPDEFDEFFQRFQQPNQKSFLVCDMFGAIAGVFNVSEIVRGAFQNAYLGFYVINDFSEKGYMSAGLKLLLKKVFLELELHRLEANIQPQNKNSINLVKRNGFRYEGYSPRYLKINGEWRGHEHWAMTLEDYIRDDEATLMKDHINIVPYRAEWPTLADSEIALLKSILPARKIIDIQHVGSTAIPGMPAKPIIDIQIAVDSLEDVKSIAIAELEKLDYVYWDKNPDSTRLFFAKGMPPYGEKRTHHVHIVEPASHHWRDKIAFRDYLRTHPNTAKEYENLKIQLAKEHQYDREKYTDAKKEFITKILRLARENK